VVTTSVSRAAADLVRVAGLASVGWAAAHGQWVNAALFSLVLLGLVLPRIVGSRPLADLGYGVVLLFAAWSAVLDLYIRYDWLDVVVHTVAGGLTAALAHRILVRCGVLPTSDAPGLRHPRVGLLVTTAALGTALGVLWEVGEWYGHTFLDHRIQVGYGDTIGDLASDAVGSIAAGLLLLLRRREGRGSPPVSVSSAVQPLTVSVVIPVKDDAVALERCLGLLRQQSVVPLEVVVVDNGSRDASAEVARRHGARVVNQPTPGIPAAAATGYDAARGELIARCDADSLPDPDWLARIVSTLTADPELDALTGTGHFYDVPRWSGAVLGSMYLGSYYVLVHLALGHTPLWGSNMALRRRTWLEVRHLVHREDAELHDDIDLSFALGPRHRVRYDAGLRVGVSGRSLRGARQLRRRLRRAFRTMELNWRRIPPWLRWQSRFAPPATADGRPQNG
jgi:hypothetical protein